jgi:hypothetical protein
MVAKEENLAQTLTESLFCNSARVYKFVFNWLQTPPIETPYIQTSISGDYAASCEHWTLFRRLYLQIVSLHGSPRFTSDGYYPFANCDIFIKPMEMTPKELDLLEEMHKKKHMLFDVEHVFYHQRLVNYKRPFRVPILVKILIMLAVHTRILIELQRAEKENFDRHNARNPCAFIRCLLAYASEVMAVSNMISCAKVPLCKSERWLLQTCLQCMHDHVYTKIREKRTQTKL